MTSQQPQTIQDYIQLEAFLLSERAGHPTGMDKIFWMQAEAIVHGRTAVVAPAGKPAKTAKKPAAKKTAPKFEAAASATQPKFALEVEPKKKPATKRAKK